MVLHLIFKKDGKYIGETVDWYWFKTGYITLLKYNVATLEENWRLPTITKD
jgi:N-acylethanolamine-hydrolysing acid amidase